MIPGQLCKHLLHKWLVRPRLGKGAHVFEITRRKPLHLREGRAQVRRQPFDDLGPPTLLRLPGQNILADLPVEQHQLAVHRQRGALLGRVDAGFQVCQPVSVTGGWRGQMCGIVCHDVRPFAARPARLCAADAVILV